MLLLLLLAVLLSHPTWVRGLKHAPVNVYGIQLPSHPTWVRGLKLVRETKGNIKIQSHPTWVRGLKRVKSIVYKNAVSRTLRGCVD